MQNKTFYCGTSKNASYTVKPAYNGTSRDRNLFVDTFLFLQVLEEWTIGNPGPRK